MIYGLWRGLGLLVELMADIVEQSGLGDFREGPRRLGQPPAREVQQVIRIGA
jgi:hypothetical protein